MSFTPTMDEQVFTFDRFEPGAVIGTERLILDDNLLRQWMDIYPTSGTETVPLGLVSVIVMRAYLQVVAPRPPGNLHVGQRFSLAGQLRLNQPLLATVICRDKRLSKLRQIVTIDVDITAEGSGEPVVRASNTLFWA